VAVGLENLKAGMWLGARSRGEARMSAPVLRAQVVPEREGELPALLRALELLGDEHGGLMPAFEPRNRRAHIRVMGEIHQQVLERTLLDAYGLRAAILPPEVLYRETPMGTGAGGFNKMTDPWKARASFRIEPGARGSGIVFVSETHVDLLHIKYQHQIEAAVYAALNEGLHGWPVTDIIVCLTDGQGSWLSRDGASSHFGPVVPLGLFAALKDAGTRLLEPVLRFEAAVDEGAMGALLYELSLIRAECEPARYAGGSAQVAGLVPVETSQRFAAKVAELSRGRGTWRMRLEGYFPAPPGCGRAVCRTTPDPCNEALYMDHITGRVAQK
jgi:ribosomal protection tetracycline resistance protein